MKEATPKANPLIEVVGVLSLTLLVCIIYSLTDYQIHIQGWQLKKAFNLDQMLSQSEQAPAQFTSQIDSLTSLNEPTPAEFDTTSQYILLTGDSMAEGLMFAFKKYAAHNGHQLKTIIWYGSSTESWARTDTLRKLIERYQPSFVILTLGSNELFIRNVEEREPHIQDIIAQAGQTQFIWIGPPNWKDDTGINALLAKNVGDGRYFLSKNLHFERGNDGRHPTRESSSVWADSISTWIMHGSRHPIRMEKPL